MSATDTNINLAMCLKSQMNIGEEIVHNICNGTISVVPWGTADWIAAVFIGTFIATFTAGAVAFAAWGAITCVRNARRWR